MSGAMKVASVSKRVQWRQGRVVCGDYMDDGVGVLSCPVKGKREEERL